MEFWIVYVIGKIIGLFAWIISSLLRLINYLWQEMRMQKSISQLLTENINQRGVLVDSELLYGGRTPLQVSGNVALLLHGETQTAGIIPFMTAGNFSSTLISGGTDKLRALAFFRACEEAYARGFPLVIIHASNLELERKISALNIHGGKYIVSPRVAKYIYDPLQGISFSEAAKIFVESSDNESFRKNPNLYIIAELIAELYSIKMGKHIPLPVMLNFDSSSLLRTIQDCTNRGLIDSAKFQDMKQRYVSAQNDLGNFGFFARSIKAKLSDFYPSGVYEAVNAEVILRRGGILIIDIIDTENGELLRMTAENLKHLRRAGIKFAACFSDINICAHNNAVLSYVTSPGGCFILSSQDISADSLVQNHSYFDRVLSFAGQCIYFGHAGGSSAVISEKLGKYDRWDISFKWDAGHGRVIPDITAGVALAKTPGAYRIQSQLIQSLQGNQIILHEAETNRIYITNLK